MTEEVLTDDVDLTQPGWQAVKVLRQNADYLVDSRDYFINFDRLVLDGYLEAVPPSASPDNQPLDSRRTFVGPYSWYVNGQGIVDSLLYAFPVPENTGYQDVFPSQKQPKGTTPPSIEGKTTVDEGDTYTLTLISRDPRVIIRTWDVDWGDGGGTEEVPGGDSTATHVYVDGPNFFTISASANDDSGTFAANDLAVQVFNLDPIITSVSPFSGTVVEGANNDINVTATDLGVNDLLIYEFDCNGDNVFETKNPTAGNKIGGCSFDNAGTIKVNVRVTDGDGGSATDFTTVTVTNVPPSIIRLDTGVATEGSNTTVTAFLSPILFDDGLTFEFDCDNNGSYEVNSQGVTSAQCFFDDNGPFDVKVLVTDDDGATAEGTIRVDVTNVPPTATFNAPSPVNEGSDILLSLTNPLDVSPVDAAALFEYDFNCGFGFTGTFGPGNSATCPTTDNGTRTVKARIKDKDGGVTEYTAGVTIENVAPTVIFTDASLALNNVDEGDTPLYIFTVSDPGVSDTLTVSVGFPDCGAFGDLVDGSLSTDAGGGSFRCSFPDGPASTTIEIQVEDTGTDSLPSSVTGLTVAVSNLDPTIDTIDTAGAGYSGTEGPGTSGTDTWTIEFNTTVSDLGADNLTLTWDFGDGSPTATGNPVFYAYDDGGPTSGSPYTVTLSVTDGDGGSAVSDTIATIANVDPTANIVVPVGGSYSGFKGGFVDFTATAEDASSADFAEGLRFFWDFEYDGTNFNPTQDSDSLTSPRRRYPNTGNFIVALQVTDKDGGSSAIVTTPVSITDPPTPLLLYVIDNSGGSSDDGEVWIYNTATNAYAGVTEDLSGNDNRGSTGITTDGVSFWTVDERGDDKTAYKYNSSFNPVNSGDFDLDDANDDPEGITVLGTTAWVVDGDDDKVYVYDLTGLTSVVSWDLCDSSTPCPADAPSDNDHPLGITTDGSSIFVVDNNKFVFEYDMSGAAVGGFDLDDPTGNPRGITTNGDFIWVLAKSVNEIKTYDMSGVYQQGGDISLQGGNNEAEGITVTPRLAS